MGTQPCRECEKEFSDSQNECPICGDKNPHGVPNPSPSPEPEPETPPPDTSTPSPPMS